MSAILSLPQCVNSSFKDQDGCDITNNNLPSISTNENILFKVISIEHYSVSPIN